MLFESNRIVVIIPAFNEEGSISKVINAIPNSVDEIIVINNGSDDSTAIKAFLSGAKVINEDRKGYGYACLKGINYLHKNPPDVIVFLDGDYSDYPEELDLIIAPILEKKVQFVIGSRVESLREKGALTLQQILGNALACFLMRILYNATFTDLGPFRAIGWKDLLSLQMSDKTYGWTVEMQLKVLRRKIKYLEVPVHYRKRIGHSKVSGTVKGTFMAGYKILTWIGKFYFSKWK
ncbi:MAG: glycosyltransferase involved in cell wall biosynthesis [Flavobacteriaceae bacterium]|mgnify:CR=1 FL=1|jgi:glycosyltransferase involved in cell wall biosynthesis|tara:strand:- start:148 stop:852 length:705 start_codon:yes stop_codon:yes gene_type:complete